MPPEYLDDQVGQVAFSPLQVSWILNCMMRCVVSQPENRLNTSGRESAGICAYGWDSRQTPGQHPAAPGPHRGGGATPSKTSLWCWSRGSHLGYWLHPRELDPGEPALEAIEDEHSTNKYLIGMRVVCPALHACRLSESDRKPPFDRASSLRSSTLCSLQASRMACALGLVLDSEPLLSFLRKPPLKCWADAVGGCGGVTPAFKGNPSALCRPDGESPTGAIPEATL